LWVVTESRVLSVCFGGIMGAESSEGAVSLINYYLREGLYHHAQLTCNNSLKKRGPDAVLEFWRAFSLFKEGLYENLFAVNTCPTTIITACVCMCAALLRCLS
jgi:hypothetical protein